ncbi:hypothetical protein [Archangium violaceum]
MSPRRTSPQPPPAADAFFASVEKLGPLSPEARAAWVRLLSPRGFEAGE